MFPTKEEFLKQFEEIDDDTQVRWETKWDFYCEYVNQPFVWDITSDHSSEQLSEDEQDWVGDQSEETLWKEMLPCAKENLIRYIREKVPLEEAKKFATKEQLKELKKIEEIELIEAI